MATKNDGSTTPISGYDFLTVGTIKRIEEAIRLAVGEHAEQLHVKEYTMVVRTHIYSTFVTGVLCGNCGATIPNEDQLVCQECGIGWAITLLIGV